MLLALTTFSALGAFAASKTDNTPATLDADFDFRDLTFDASDFDGNADQTIDIANFTVSIDFAKAAGEGLAPPYPTNRSPYYNEMFFQLLTPTGTLVTLVDVDSFNTGTAGTNFDGTITFSNNAANLVNWDPNQPQAGTFRPVCGDFNLINGETAIGTFSLIILDSKAQDALRYRSFTINIGAAPTAGATAAPEPGSLALCAGLLPLTGTILARRRRARVTH